MIKLDAPDQWGDDELSAFQRLANRNEMSTFAHRPKLIKLLTAMDSTFAACVQECLRLHEANFGLLFFPNSHNHFRATVRCVTSGQCLAAFPAGRAALETAMSGWYLAKYPEHVDKWKNKPADKSGSTKWSTDFSFSAARRKLEIDNSKLASQLQSLYQYQLIMAHIPPSKRWKQISEVKSLTTAAISTPQRTCMKKVSWMLWLLPFYFGAAWLS